jgi:hypothetical protein
VLQGRQNHDIDVDGWLQAQYHGKGPTDKIGHTFVSILVKHFHQGMPKLNSDGGRQRLRSSEPYRCDAGGPAWEMR